MGALFFAFVPILILMALPLVIPVVGVWIGALMDRLSPTPHSPAEDAVLAAQVRTAEFRAELEREQAANAKPAA
ncbi:hypothetical protein Back2_13260 [Nocardioides baekrokdamisoli]|uniref:Uncharacterized protein n=1 Tax=Nocardioides baekrokdamisoli TaxID=1804624 RepID=A0A3G9J222_9ACTN|nr:hypothetical protein [Nocardioides baekrokdamisoli]BBH17039.1 hypothetical protein Back2_13260 [Nocardioides baekrokdamisoli]